MKIFKAFIFLFIMIAFTTLHAQTSVIPKVGINISNVTFGEDNELKDESEARTGITGGFSIYIPISEIISFQPEVLFSQKGYVADLKAFGVTILDVYLKLNYIDLPIMIRTDLKAGPLAIHLNAGPTLGYMVSGKVNWKTPLGNIDGKIEFDEDADLLDPTEMDARRLEIGLGVGGGIGFPIGENKLIIDVRYNRSFTDYNNRETSKNSGIALTAGFQIPL